MRKRIHSKKINAKKIGEKIKNNVYVNIQRIDRNEWVRRIFEQ